MNTYEKKYEVVTTEILTKTDMSAPNGRSFEFMEIAYKDFSFLPGQFVMIKLETGDFSWAYPYLVLKSSENGFWVTAVSGSSLYGKAAGQKLIVWGANGRGITPEKLGNSQWVGNEDNNTTNLPITLVCEPGTAFLTAPFLMQWKQACSMVFLGTKEDALPELCSKSTSFLPDAKKAVAHLEASKGPVIMALNLSSILAVTSTASERLKERITVFAATEIACGIGSCKGCYLHSPEIRTGIPVCCNGPYLPYNTVDFVTDAKCFHTFL